MHHRSRGIFIITCILFCLAFIYQSAKQLHGDIYYFLTLGKEILSGKILYVQIIDLNSPVIVYYHAFIDLTSQWFRYNPSHIFIITTLCGFSLSLLISIRLIQKIDFGNAKYVYFFTLIILMLFAGNDFGQREYMMVILLLPYILVSTLRLNNQTSGNSLLLILTGILAALGVSIKQNFILLPLFIELFLTIQKRKLTLRLEFAALLIELISYALIILWKFPAYIKIILLTLETYRGYLVMGFTVINPETVAVLIVVLLVILLAKREKQNPALYFITGLCIVFWAIATLQGKGFSHHYFPFKIYFGGLCIYIFTLIKNYSKIGVYFKIYLTLLLVLLIVKISIIPILNYQNYLCVKCDSYQEIVNYLNHEVANTPIAVLSTELYPMAYIDYFTSVEWTTSYRNYWMLPGLYKNEAKQAIPFPYHLPNQMTTAEQELFYTTIDEIITKNPKYIFILKPGYMNGFMETTFDFREYFSQDTRFKEYLKKYSFDKQLFKYNIYKLQTYTD